MSAITMVLAYPSNVHSTVSFLHKILKMLIPIVGIITKVFTLSSRNVDCILRPS